MLQNTLRAVLVYARACPALDRLALEQLRKEARRYKLPSTNERAALIDLITWSDKTR